MRPRIHTDTLLLPIMHQLHTLQLSAAVLSVAAAALSAIDLRSHAADHPRLGVLDHVSLHPLGAEATLQHAAQAAASLGQQLAAPPFGLPVYFYGAAHPAGRKLAEIRRRLGRCAAAGIFRQHSRGFARNHCAASFAWSPWHLAAWD